MRAIKAQAKTLAIILLLVAVSANVALVKGINVELKKDITPSAFKKNDTVTVRLIIKNNDSVAYLSRIRDSYNMDLFTPLNEREFEKGTTADPKKSTSWSYIWVFNREFTLNPNEEKIFEFKLNFLGSNGVNKINLVGFDFLIPSENFSRQAAGVEVSTGSCNMNSICEPWLDEFPSSCPSDCGDNYCDNSKDGVCDPDCPKGEDPDCLPVLCGNGKCDSNVGESYENCPADCEKPIICGDGYCDPKKENYGNCPLDCPSGLKDGYCDGVKDGICDPDCNRTSDPDCLCNKDGKCDYGIENYLNCPQDCPSGSKDGYCDKAADKICDPDCPTEEDIDCGKDFSLYITLSVLFVILVLAFIAIKKRSDRDRNW